MGYGRWAMGDGQWAMGDGQWAMGYGCKKWLSGYVIKWLRKINGDRSKVMGDGDEIG